MEGEKDFTVSDPITDPSQTTYTLSPPPGPGKKVEFYVLSSNEKGDGPNPDIKTAYSGRDSKSASLCTAYSYYSLLAFILQSLFLFSKLTILNRLSAAPFYLACYRIYCFSSFLEFKGREQIIEMLVR